MKLQLKQAWHYINNSVMFASLHINRIKDQEGIINFIDFCKSLFPKTRSVRYNERRVLDIEILTVYDHLRITTHHHVKESKHPFFKEVSIEIYNKQNKSFNEIITLSSPKSTCGDYILEEYWKGYERTEHELEKFIVTDGHYHFEGYKIGPIEIFTIYFKDEIIYFGFLKQKILRSFYQFKSGDKAIAYFPMLNDNEITISKSSVATFISAIGTVSTMAYFYHNVFLSIAMVIVSACLLWINDFINPRRNPILNILQAIFIAVVIFFIR